MSRRPLRNRRHHGIGIPAGLAVAVSLAMASPAGMPMQRDFRSGSRIKGKRRYIYGMREGDMINGALKRIISANDQNRKITVSNPKSSDDFLRKKHLTKHSAHPYLPGAPAARTHTYLARLRRAPIPTWRACGAHLYLPGAPAPRTHTCWDSGLVCKQGSWPHAIIF